MGYFRCLCLPIEISRLKDEFPKWIEDLPLRHSLPDPVIWSYILGEFSLFGESAISELNAQNKSTSLCNLQNSYIFSTHLYVIESSLSCLLLIKTYIVKGLLLGMKWNVLSYSSIYYKN